MVQYSVIIPTLNQSFKLRLCLEHLSRIDFDPERFEVIVIDNGSNDETKAATISFQSRIINLRYHYCARLGLMAARHMGAEEARGEILCFLDDDSMVTKEWLKGISESFRHDHVVVAGGPCIPKYEVEPPHWMKYFWEKTKEGRYNGFLSLVDFGNKSRWIYPVFVFGCNYSIRRKTFFEFGGTCPDYYPENCQQYIGDGESGLSLKLFNAGYKAFYNPIARIYHSISASRLTIEYFCWKRKYNGIHASYRIIRREHGLDIFIKAGDKDISTSTKTFLKFRLRLGRAMKRFIKIIKQFNEALTLQRSLIVIRKKIEKSYQDGFSFHQKAVKTNPKLLEWVLRENYLGENGKLPE